VIMPGNVVSLANLNGGLALTTAEAHKLILLLLCGQKNSPASSKTDLLVRKVCNILTGHGGERTPA
jgi:hypothetical protein